MGIVFAKETENYDKENGTPTVLLLGNGFDLQLGLKSRYEDFLLYLFFLKVLHHLSVDKIQKRKNDYLKVLKEGENEYFGYRENSESKSCFLSILEIAEKRFDSFEKENYGILVNNVLLSCIVSVLTQNLFAFLPFGSQGLFDNIFATDCIFLDKSKNYDDITELPAKKNLELNISVELLRGKLKQYIDQITGTFDSNYLSMIKGWMDVESIIECLLTKNQHLLTRFSLSNDNKSSLDISLSDYCDEQNLKDDVKNEYEMREALKQFTNEFCKFNQIQVDHVKEQKDLIESLKIELNKEIDLYKSGQDATFIKKVDLFSDIHYVLNYNYSSLAELFQEYSKNTLHVNGKSEDETAIFGINEDTCFSQNGAQQYQEQQNKYCTYFFKQSQRVLKHVLGFNYENLNSLSHGYFTQQFVKKTLRGFNLIIYGHSCSPADFDVIKTLLTHPNLRVAVVLCYNKEAMLSAYHNIRTMLGPQKIAEMMQVSSKMEKRLFFLERQES